MPHHISAAFTQSFPCYGFDNKEDLGDMMAAVGVQLRPREIENLVDFILAEIKDIEVISFAYCERYYGVGSRNCEEYQNN